MMAQKSLSPSAAPAHSRSSAASLVGATLFDCLTSLLEPACLLLIDGDLAFFFFFLGDRFVARQNNTYNVWNFAGFFFFTWKRQEKTSR